MYTVGDKVRYVAPEDSLVAADADYASVLGKVGTVVGYTEGAPYALEVEFEGVDSLPFAVEEVEKA